jgi:hypothetical protein
VISTSSSSLAHDAILETLAPLALKLSMSYLDYEISESLTDKKEFFKFGSNSIVETRVSFNIASEISPV